jgi:hypothetical protein
MKTIQGPAIFLAQFAGDAAPFNSLDAIGRWAAGLGYKGEGYTSFTIASPTGEGLTTALSFTRERRCTLKDSFRFV